MNMDNENGFELTIPNTNADTDKPLPRFDLREPAFRKYESLIARACAETFTYDPSLLKVNAHTFCARFRDALRAFKLYSYLSILIPSNFDLRNLRPVELSSGLVKIINLKYDASLKDKSSLYNNISSSIPNSIHTLMRRISQRELTDIPIIIPNLSYDERAAIVAIGEAYNRSNPEISCRAVDYEEKIYFYM